MKVEDLSDMSMGQRMPENGPQTPETKERHLHVSEGAWLCQHLDLGLVASKTVRQ